MKLKLTDKSSGTWLTIMVFALLLLLAPCSVRNYFQTALDIPLTEVTSKSKSTVNTANCNASEINEIANELPQQTKKYSNALIATYFSFTNTDINKDHDKTDVVVHEIQLDVDIPYYILYQNLKIHLS